MARQQASLFDLMVLAVIGISFGALLLLVLNRFSPWYALIIGVAAVFLLLKLWRIPIVVNLRAIPIHLALILFVALIFRFQPYLYILGGQDQGIYVNMAGSYLKKGSTFIVDDVREKAIASGLKDLYDNSNQKEWRPIQKGEYEGEHLPGIFIKDAAKSLYVYQFYPLFPLWMAVAGNLAGEKHCVYSLAFFSLLSIAAFYYLALAFSGGHLFPAVLVAALLAVNPLHAFFSKFPVSEVAALAFCGLGFLYLLWYWQESSAGANNRFYLVLSAGLFGCLFFTRITGFLYVPLFYVLLLLTLLFEEDPRVRNQMSGYALSVMTLYILSVFYGLFYSYPYSHDIYKAAFGEVLHSGWETKLLFLYGLAAGILIVAWFLRGKGALWSNRNPFLRRVKENTHWIFWGILIFVFLLALRKAYALGFTDLYAHLRGDLGGHGWESFRRSNIFVVMLYLSPVGFGIFVYAMLRIFPQKSELPWIFLVLFLAMFWYFHTVMRFSTRYHYYFARYLLGEVVPFSLLVVSLIVGEWFRRGRWGKVWAIALSLAMGAYFVYYTSYQFLGRSAGSAYSALKEVEEHVKDKDLLLLAGVTPPLNWLIQTPLSLFFDLNTCNVKRMLDLENAQGKNFLLQFEDIHVLSRQRLKAPYLEFIQKVSYSSGDFEKSRGIPTRYYPFHATFYLHKVRRSVLLRKVIYPEERPEALVNFHDSIWTDGDGTIRNIQAPLNPEDRFVVLRTRGLNPFLKGHAWPAPDLYINGTKQPFYSRRKNAYTYSIQGKPSVIEDIRIVSPSFVPKDAGMSEDSRRLGVDIESVAITDQCEDHLIYPRLIYKDLKNFYDATFTNGNGLIENIGYVMKPGERVVTLHTYGWNPFLKGNQWPAPELYLDGIRQKFYQKIGNSYAYAIESSQAVINQIRIVSPTFVPKETGIGEDARMLGVDIDFIEISERPPGAKAEGRVSEGGSQKPE